MSVVAVELDRRTNPKDSMYAVIETGGKQYRVEVGTELEVELLEGAPGDSITLDRVLLVADGDESSIGRPVVADAAVEAEVVRRDRGDKVISFKYRPKARRRVKKGHRQELTVLRITDVKLNGKSAAEAKRKADAQKQMDAAQQKMMRGTLGKEAEGKSDAEVKRIYDAKMAGYQAEAKKVQGGGTPTGVPASDMARSNAQMKSMTGKSMQDIQKMTPAEQEAFARQMEKQYGGAK